MLRFSLAYFSLCDCSRVVIFPSRHLSPCQHGEAHCRQYPCLWIHWWCFVAQLWFFPLTNSLRFLSAATVGRWSLCNANCFMCLDRNKCLFVAGNSMGCQVISASMNGRQVCRRSHEQRGNICICFFQSEIHFFKGKQINNWEESCLEFIESIA